ncbi:MAG: hypothetical protein ACTSQJ_03210 [Promethearchaeota archaeon]
MKYQYIKDMLFARIAGTAIHLNINDNNETSQISYKKYRIWGIKTLVKLLVQDIFDTIYNNLPKNEKQLNPEKDLPEPIKNLCAKYNISYNKVLEFIEKRREPKQIWETLDNDLRAIFMINAFFEAFEFTLIEFYYIAISISRFIWLNKNIKPKLKRSDFGLKDFGFIFRARGYSQIFSKKIYNNGFSNTVKRLNRILYKEYIDTFILKIESKEKKNKQKNKIYKDLSEEKKYAIEMLRQGNSKEKLDAINLIVENRITEALNELEYLLSYKNEEVMNAAFDAILVLKNLVE